MDTTVDELTVNGNCSLREAIQTFVTDTAFDACPGDAADDTIIMPAGTYNLSAALGELLINADGNLTITGAGAGLTIIDAGGAIQAIRITNNANVTISGVTIRNANSGAAGLGGGISVNGTGSPTGATLLLRDSVVENSAAQFGGGVYVFNGTLTIEGSTISGNTAITRGGGVFTNNSATSILNTTIHGNTVTGASGTAPFDGGGLRSFGGGSVTIRNSTISGNSAANDGGGIATLTTPASAFTFSNSIVAGNTDGGSNAPDCLGAMTSDGYNLVGDSAGCTLTAGTGDQFGGITTPGAIDPQLGALQLNGGSTPTRAIAAGSPARNAGNPAAPGSAPACAPTDQRGIARPQSAQCDIGAFERAETPTITALSPDSTLVGGSAFTLVVQGSGFIDGRSTVRWDGADRATTFISNSELRITVPAGDLATAGTASVTVFTDLPDGGTSAPATFTITNPAPTLSSISPTSATAGAGNTLLTVGGSNFVATSVVRWNGANRTTTFVSNSELRITIPAADLATAGTASVTVFTPTPGGGTTSSLTFDIVNPAPVLSSLSPTSATAGAGNTLLTVTGSNFVATSVVRWNGANRTTTFVSNSELRITIPAADLATAGTANVTVFTPTPGGGTTSSLTFDIVNPAPVLSSLSPTSATAGAGNTLLTVTGSNFVATSVVRWNGANRTTTFVSNSELRITIPAGDLATAGTASVTVFTPTPGGGTSSAQTFTITNPVPTLTSISPDRVPQQTGGIALNVTGTNFVAGSVVRWNGANRTTAFVSTTQLDVTLQAGDLATAGTAAVTVFNPAPGGGTTTSATVTIFGPPAITGQPQSQSIASGGSATLTVTATGEPPLSYQWYIGASPDTGSPIAGADEASLTVTPDASTSYWVRVSNAAGGTDSDSATVSIVGAPAITQQPQSVSIFSGQTTTLTVVATGQGLTYQWYEGASGDTSAPVAGATGASFTTPALTATTSYWVRVTNSVGTSANSTAAVVTVNGPPAITAQPQSVTITSGQTATLAVTATGASLSYQWYVGSSPSTAQPITNATSASLSVSPTVTTSYWVRVSNPAGVADSSTATVTVNPPPNPVPTITAITPASVQAGGPGFTLAVTGADFVPGAVVRWNGQSRATTRVSSTRLEISVSAADIATAGSAAITVFNPTPGGGSSAARTLTIEPRTRFLIYLPLLRR